jgi:CHAP domain
MSLDTALARIASLQTLLQPQPVQQPLPQTATQFSSMLQGANASSPTAMIPGATSAPGTPAGQAILNAIRPEVGVAEQPPGSNDSPRIAQYRQATAGSGVGPWCAYFVSWAARQAGVPIGDSGQGFGRVDDVMAWGQKTGKALPAGSTPAPGDLIVWDEHIGIVERVDPDGTIHTIEGNSSDKVSQRTYGSDGGGAVGYVRLG